MGLTHRYNKHHWLRTAGFCVLAPFFLLTGGLWVFFVNLLDVRGAKAQRNRMVKRARRREQARRTLDRRPDPERWKDADDSAGRAPETLAALSAADIQPYLHDPASANRAAP